MTSHYVRIDDDGNGGSRFVDVSVETHELPRHAGVTERISVSNPVNVRGLTFIEREPGTDDVQWNPAPRRQFYVVLAGTLEIETTNGEVRRFGPGDVVMAADMGTKGHRPRVVDLPHRALIIPVEDGH